MTGAPPKKTAEIRAFIRAEKAAKRKAAAEKWKAQSRERWDKDQIAKEADRQAWIAAWRKYEAEYRERIKAEQAAAQKDGMDWSKASIAQRAIWAAPQQERWNRAAAELEAARKARVANKQARIEARGADQKRQRLAMLDEKEKEAVNPGWNFKGKWEFWAS